MKNQEADDYVTAALASDVLPDQMIGVTVAGIAVILARWDGKLFAFNQQCPHAAADLSQGDLYKGRVECPDHGYRFDLRSGRAVWPEDEVCRLKLYLVKEEDGAILVKLN